MWGDCEKAQTWCIKNATLGADVMAHWALCSSQGHKFSS